MKSWSGNIKLFMNADFLALYSTFFLVVFILAKTDLVSRKFKHQDTQGYRRYDVVWGEVILFCVKKLYISSIIIGADPI
jgi:hypothetical protein